MATNVNNKCTGCYKRESQRRVIQGFDLEVCHGCGKDLDFALGFLAVKLEISDDEMGQRLISPLGRLDSESPTHKKEPTKT